MGEAMAAQPQSPFGALLRRFRLDANLSQETLARRAGLSREALSALERGIRRNPYPETVRLLADALELDGTQHTAFTAASRWRDSAHQPVPSSHNLPAELTVLIGRDDALADVVAPLQSGAVRLLTITGPPGVGKTRLGVAAAAELQAQFPDGVRFFSLAPLRKPFQVVETIAMGLDLWEADDETAPTLLPAHIGDRRLLLVLDNFEHVIEAAPLVAELLRSCPGLAVLATSRSPLRVRGEQVCLLPPLALPEQVPALSLATLKRSPAIALFAERARAVRPDFALTQGNIAAVATICRHLDGLPLALELAAARVKILSPTELLPHLEHQLALLTDGARDLPERHQSLRAAIAWSYDSLTPGAQLMFRHLAVFARGGTVEAVARVATLPEDEALEHLTMLAEQSLVQPRESAEGTRLELLETVRAYGLEQLEPDEESSARRAHATYFLELVETAQAAFDGPARATWLTRLTVDLENCLVAMEWARDNNEVELGLRLASDLAPFWDLRGHATGGRRWLEMFLRKAGIVERDIPVPLRARALRAAGDLAIAHNDLQRADALFGAAQELQLSQAAMESRARQLDDYVIEAHE